MKAKIVLADDHKILRDGLKTIINSFAGFEVIGEADDGREAVKLCAQLVPDVVIMDVSMQGLNGIDASSQILKTNPEIKIIALSMHSTKHFVTGMFQAGAWGYLLKDCATEELVTAIKTVLSGKKYISQYISGIILDEYLSGSGTDKDSSLSDREREILQLIAEGQSVKTISDKLSLSAKTIETHRKNIMDKLKIYTIPELTKYAIRNGITSLDS